MNYLGHSFCYYDREIYNDTYIYHISYRRKYVCNKCSINAYTYSKENYATFWYYTILSSINCNQKILNLTCDEYLIKNILE